MKGITFDLDNTLIDFLKLKCECVKSAATAMINAGLTMEYEKVKNELFDTYLEDIEGNHVFQDFLERNSISSMKILAAAINAHAKTRFTYLRTYPHVSSVLSTLKKKYKLAVITDAPGLKAYQRLDALGLVDHFDFIITKDDTGVCKPNQLPFETALAKMSLSPSEVMHVGDWPEKDITGAKNMGMIACWARYGNQNYCALDADIIIDSFEELLEKIEV